VGLFVRRSELAHEQRNANFADPLAKTNRSACMAKKFAVQVQNPSFSTKLAHCRLSLRLHIEKAGSRPRASAFIMLPNWICGRSESRLSALCVDDVNVGRDHDDRQKRAETRRLRMRQMSLAAMTAVGLEAPLGQPGVVAEILPPQQNKKGPARACVSICRFMPPCHPLRRCLS
jgi:hypothetical protein